MAAKWPVVRLGDYCSKIGSGATPKGGREAYLKESRFALIRSQNIYNDGFRKEGLAFISAEQARELDSVAVQEQDVLLNITGDSVCRVCLAPTEWLPARVNQHVSIIRTDKSRLDPRFLHYFLSSPRQQEVMLDIAASGATRNALTKTMIENFEVPCPDLSTQATVAEILSAFDFKIHLNNKVNQTLEQMAQALFKSWFVDFDPVLSKAAGREPESMDISTAALFPSEFQQTELGKVPKGWSIGSLDLLLILQRGFDLPAVSREHGKYPVLAASGPSGTHAEYKVRGPGVTTGRSGLLGKVFYVHEDFWPLNTSLWIKEFKRARPIYAYHLLKSLDFQTFDAGSAVPTLNRNHVHSLRVLVPPLEIIERFEEITLPMFSCLHTNQKQSKALAQTRDALLPKLISGGLHVPETGNKGGGGQ